MPPLPDDLHADDRELFDAALKVMRDLGATTVEVPALPETDETPVLHYEFARDVDAYLARLPPARRCGPWPSSPPGTTRTPTRP